MEPNHNKIASPRAMQAVNVSEVDIQVSQVSVSKSIDSDDVSYYPSVLIADDDMVQLNGLEGQVRYVKGPDGKDQVCDKAHSGYLLIEKYRDRLDLSLTSDVRPFLVVITDLHMPGMTGF